MTDESMTEFHNRRSIDEKALAEQSLDVVQVIAHDQLSLLHAHKVLGSETDPLFQEKALEVAAVDGKVAVSGVTGEVTQLTPTAAALTSDRLLAQARVAGRQVLTPTFLRRSARLKGHTEK